MIIEPSRIRQEIPLLDSSIITRHRNTITSILQGSDPRRLLIVGPCSIHDLNSAREYAKNLSKLSREVEDHFFIVMRTYFEKSRTSHGWKGFLSDPLKDGSHDILTGIRQARTFLSELASLGLAAGLEFLDPLAAYYLEDLVSWGSIGARTTQSQIHRQLASLLPMPIGFKNTPDGSIFNAVQAASVAKEPHIFLHMNIDGKLEIVRSEGNKSPHIVLRGGEKNPNYTIEYVHQAVAAMRAEGLFPSILIDCAHDNSFRNPEQQKKVVSHIIDDIFRQAPEVRGMMIESHLVQGRQSFGPQAAANLSITDPCLDWHTTESLIRYAASTFKFTNMRNTPCTSVQK